MPHHPLLPVIAAAVLCSALPAAAQQAPGGGFPDGPGKDTFVAVCGGCHDINRARAGYTPEGWHTRRAHDAEHRRAGRAEGSWPTRHGLSDQELPRAAAARRASIIPGPVQASIKEWAVPTPARARTIRSPTSDGAIWWTGQLANKLGRLDPKTGAIKEYPLKTPHTGPHGLTEDKDGNIWFTGNNAGADRQARSEDRRGHRIQDARSRRRRIRTRSSSTRRHPVVHGAAGQHGRPARSQDRRDQARHVADAEVAALRHGDQLQGRAVSSSSSAPTRSRASIRKTMAIKEYTLPDAGARPRRIAHHARRHDLVHGFLARLSRPARSEDRQGHRSGRRRAGRSRSPTASSSPRARSGTTNPSPSRTRSCASIRRPRSSRPGRSPAAATSCATWMSRRTAIR